MCNTNRKISYTINNKSAMISKTTSHVTILANKLLFREFIFNIILIILSGRGVRREWFSDYNPSWGGFNRGFYF